MPSLRHLLHSSTASSWFEVGLSILGTPDLGTQGRKRKTKVLHNNKKLSSAYMYVCMHVYMYLCTYVCTNVCIINIDIDVIYADYSESRKYEKLFCNKYMWEA